MGRVSAAFRIFFRTLSDARTAAQVEGLLSSTLLPTPPTSAPPPVAPSPGVPAATSKPASTQNPAVTLLATLQREARLVDFLKEDLAGHPDALIGAAAREVHRDAGKVLDRIFGLKPIRSESEGTTIEVPEAQDGGKLRLTGKVTANRPVQGALKHHGWETTRCELPAYTGTMQAANVVAPAEVEIP